MTLTHPTLDYQLANSARKREGIMDAHHAAAITRWLTSRWCRGPRVHIAPTARDLPVRVPADVRGLLLKNEVHLVAAQPAHALVKTLAHEAVGHFGLRQLLGRQWPHFMVSLQDGARAGDPGLLVLRNHIRRAYLDDHGSYNLSSRQEADEIAAYVAEDMVQMGTGAIRPTRPWVQAIDAAAGRVLREGLCLDRKVSRSELEGALFLAAKHLEGWPWHPVRQRICKAWGTCRNMLGMHDKYKPPMSVQESERLLAGARQQELNEGLWKSSLLNFGVWLGVIALLIAIGLLISAFSAAIGAMAAGILIALFMYFHDRI